MSQAGSPELRIDADAPRQLSRAQFVERFEGAWRSLWCIAVAVLGTREGAEDVVQEAALIAWGKVAEFDPSTSFAAWMGQIVRFTALNQGRRMLKQHHAETSLELGADATVPESDASKGSEAEDDRRHVRRALNALDDTVRACVLMRTLAGMTYQEIALALGVPEGTAACYVHRARALLRESIAGTSAPSTGPKQS
jgi:RNA polymerase sigma-70 factor (ECF subfamily)